MRVRLLELDLVRGHRIALGIEDEKARTSGAIVNGAHKDIIALLSSLGCR